MKRNHFKALSESQLGMFSLIQNLYTHTDMKVGEALLGTYKRDQDRKYGHSKKGKA